LATSATSLLDSANAGGTTLGTTFFGTKAAVRLPQQARSLTDALAVLNASAATPGWTATWQGVTSGAAELLRAARPLSSATPRVLLLVSNSRAETSKCSDGSACASPLVAAAAEGAHNGSVSLLLAQVGWPVDFHADENGALVDSDAANVFVFPSYASLASDSAVSSLVSAVCREPARVPWRTAVNATLLAAGAGGAGGAASYVRLTDVDASSPLQVVVNSTRCSSAAGAAARLQACVGYFPNRWPAPWRAAGAVPSEESAGCTAVTASAGDDSGACEAQTLTVLTANVAKPGWAASNSVFLALSAPAAPSGGARRLQGASGPGADYTLSAQRCWIRVANVTGNNTLSGPVVTVGDPSRDDKCGQCPSDMHTLTETPGVFGACANRCLLDNYWAPPAGYGPVRRCAKCHDSCALCTFFGGSHDCTACPAGSVLLPNALDANATAVAAAGSVHASSGRVGSCVPICPPGQQLVQAPNPALANTSMCVRVPTDSGLQEGPSADTSLQCIFGVPANGTASSPPSSAASGGATLEEHLVLRAWVRMPSTDAAGASTYMQAAVEAATSIGQVTSATTSTTQAAQLDANSAVAFVRAVAGSLAVPVTTVLIVNTTADALTPLPQAFADSLCVSAANPGGSTACGWLRVQVEVSLPLPGTPGDRQLLFQRLVETAAVESAADLLASFFSPPAAAVSTFHLDAAGAALEGQGILQVTNGAAVANTSQLVAFLNATSVAPFSSLSLACAWVPSASALLAGPGASALIDTVLANKTTAFSVLGAVILTIGLFAAGIFLFSMYQRRRARMRKQKARKARGDAMNAAAAAIATMSPLGSSEDEGEDDDDEGEGEDAGNDGSADVAVAAASAGAVDAGSYLAHMARTRTSSGAALMGAGDGGADITAMMQPRRSVAGLGMAAGEENEEAAAAAREAVAMQQARKMKKLTSVSRIFRQLAGEEPAAGGAGRDDGTDSSSSDGSGSDSSGSDSDSDCGEGEEGSGSESGAADGPYASRPATADTDTSAFTLPDAASLADPSLHLHDVTAAEAREAAWRREQAYALQAQQQQRAEAEEQAHAIRRRSSAASLAAGAGRSPSPASVAPLHAASPRDDHVAQLLAMAAAAAQSIGASRRGSGEGGSGIQVRPVAHGWEQSVEAGMPVLSPHDAAPDPGFYAGGAPSGHGGGGGYGDAYQRRGSSAAEGGYATAQQQGQQQAARGPQQPQRYFFGGSEEPLRSPSEGRDGSRRPSALSGYSEHPAALEPGAGGPHAPHHSTPFQPPRDGPHHHHDMIGVLSSPAAAGGGHGAYQQPQGAYYPDAEAPVRVQAPPRGQPAQRDSVYSQATGVDSNLSRLDSVSVAGGRSAVSGSVLGLGSDYEGGSLYPGGYGGGYSRGPTQMSGAPSAAYTGGSDDGLSQAAAASTTAAPRRSSAASTASSAAPAAAGLTRRGTSPALPRRGSSAATVSAAGSELPSDTRLVPGSAAGSRAASALGSDAAFAAAAAASAGVPPVAAVAGGGMGPRRASAASGIIRTESALREGEITRTGSVASGAASPARASRAGSFAAAAEGQPDAAAARRHPSRAGSFAAPAGAFAGAAAADAAWAAAAGPRPSPGLFRAASDSMASPGGFAGGPRGGPSPAPLLAPAAASEHSEVDRRGSQASVPSVTSFARWAGGAASRASEASAAAFPAAADASGAAWATPTHLRQELQSEPAPQRAAAGRNSWASAASAAVPDGPSRSPRTSRSPARGPAAAPSAWQLLSADSGRNWTGEEAAGAPVRSGRHLAGAASAVLGGLSSPGAARR
jgi:hypothetical protein